MSDAENQSRERMDRSVMDPVLLKECHENFVEGLTLIASLWPGGAAERCGGVTVVRTCYPAAQFNLVIALDAVQPPAGLSELIDRMLVRTGVPWALLTTKETSEELAPIREEFQLNSCRATPGMVYDFAGRTMPRPPKELDIHRVTERAEMHVYWRLCAEVFEMDAGLLDRVAGMMIAHPDACRRIGCYLGYVEGRPVSTSMLIATPRVAQVANVATQTEFRGRGYGGAITLRAAFEGHRDGCKVSYLAGATELGRPVYEKLGYQTREELSYWLPSPATTAPSSPK